jgi:hypothetical protein
MGKRSYRSSSCPASAVRGEYSELGAWQHRDAMLTEPPCDRSSRSNSSGVCGGESPNIWRAMLRIRHDLMNTQLCFRPTVRIESWKGHVYAAVWWGPQAAPLAVREPWRWHTTLLRAWCASTSLEKLADEHFKRWQAILNDAMAELLLGYTHVQVWLCSPPWRKSWTFGVPEEVAHILPALHIMLSVFIRARDPGANIIVEADSHISWN